jgi:DSF synthase
MTKEKQMKPFEQGLVNYQHRLLSHDYGQVFCRFDAKQQTLWSYLNQPERIPCINHELLLNLHAHHEDIQRSGGYVQLENEEVLPIRYSVFASATPGYFNMGGDLQKMATAIRNKDRAQLQAYAKLSIDVVAQRAFRFNLDHVTKISLLQGEVLGAGIEAAMTSDVLIAERQSVFCFPELFFNMIPGMGAYSFIARKAGMAIADKMILDCERFTAEECLEMGLIDMVVDEGQGVEAVQAYIQKSSKQAEGFLSAQKAKARINPLTYSELEDIVNVWVENALRLNERDLKVMDRFYRAQSRLFPSQEVSAEQIQQTEMPQQQAVNQ